MQEKELRKINSYIKQGDCLELLKEIPNESVNLILCDLPYQETGNKWDKFLDMQKLFKEYRRIVTEDGCIALTGTFKFGSHLKSIAPDLYKYEWVWQKENGTNFPSVHYQPFRVHEYIFIFGKGRVTNGSRTPMKYHPQKTAGKPYEIVSGRTSSNYRGGIKDQFKTANKDGLRHPISIQKFNRDKTKLHPTQKPVALMEYIIRTYTDEGDTVLDNCMGSGSTIVAAVKNNRKYIGFEIDEIYFDIAKTRIKNEENQHNTCGGSYCHSNAGDRLGDN